MNWSGKAWALETRRGVLLAFHSPPYPKVYRTRAEARHEQIKWYPATKVVRVQVDVKVIE